MSNFLLAFKLRVNEFYGKIRPRFKIQVVLFLEPNKFQL